jgi:multiple sugar transport system substrate-binding protein
VAAESDVKEAALDFAAFMAAPEMVKVLAVTGGTGINPARYSQFEDIDLWVEAGFDQESAEDYLDAILTGINHPNAVIDLRISGTAEYQQTLDVEITRAIAGEISAQEALDNAAAAWEEITDRLGREAQLDQYRNSVGYTGM